MRPFIVFLLCASLLGCGGDGSSLPPPPAGARIFAVDRQVMKPFVWFFADFDNTEAGFDAQLAYGDPLRTTTLVLQDWLQRGDLATTRSRVEKMVANWQLDQPDGKLSYTFAYGRLPADWWSGMDSWSFPMLLVGLWQEKGDARFKTIADNLIASAKRDVLDGGTVWRQDSGCWFSEYAWDSMSEDDEFYVLNGHLYALHAIKMLANATEDTAMDDLYQCGLRATKARAAEYAMGTQWALYMLHPKVINQTHCVIFETMQFDALGLLDPDPFYAEEAAKRRDLLQRYFPVRIRTGGGGNQLELSALGAPHPYSIDTYALHADCTDGTVRERHAMPDPEDTRTPILDRFFLHVPTALDPASTRCRVESEYVGYRHNLFDMSPITLAGPIGPGRPFAFDIDVLLDAYTTGPESVVIDPDRRVSTPGDPPTYLDTQGRLVLTPASPLTWDADELLGLEFAADGELAIGVTIVSDGLEYFRYYPRTPASGKTLVLLSPLGFDGGQNIRNVEKLTFFVYTDQQPGPVAVTSPRLLKFANQVELYEYFKAMNPTFYTE